MGKRRAVSVDGDGSGAGVKKFVDIGSYNVRVTEIMAHDIKHSQFL